ncbi:TPA: 50S ribosomal protein L15 [Candidatus Saccharibacteria bacterium]|nr:50S ribosomal protein L15 [Candidatus Saccharibacteria bacterium]HIO87382.1 50S ribosomal protein L15 [Candidatus Saccharibacteria bacterium]
MLFQDLDVSKKKTKKRVGRGISAGQGKTAGRGTKGQASRSGYRTKPNFEGGQTPLVKRLPKLKGFKSKRAAAQEVTTDDLNSLKTKKITPEVLAEAGLVKDAYEKIKLIGATKLESAKDVEVHAVTAGAQKAVKDAGGSVKLVEKARPKTSKKDDASK